MGGGGWERYGLVRNLYVFFYAFPSVQQDAHKEHFTKLLMQYINS